MRRLALLLAALSAACGAGAPQAVDVRTSTPCSYCRMSMSDVRFAGQIVAPGEEPLVFDDIGCMANHLKAHPAPAGAAAFVADHRTKEWVRAEFAVFTRVPGLQTPMQSGLIAHASTTSREQDQDAVPGTQAAVVDVFGDALPRGSHAR
jgi:copper chaperone NosL